jgi:hypothetical protein
MGKEGVRETEMNIRNIETVSSGWLNNSNGCIYTCYHTHTHIYETSKLPVCPSVCFAVTNISMDQ